MSRVGRLQATAGALLRAARSSCCTTEQGVSRLQSSPAWLQIQQQRSVGIVFSRAFHGSTLQAADVTAGDFGKATGAERDELEAKAKGIENPYHEDWLDAPFGTEDKPVEVTSSFTERVVGVPDPYDDSIIWWGKIEVGQPPKQIIEGGEYFTLRQIQDDSPHH
ncbi:hypothetical protein WJX73_004284 [Symbiochloris irregularis]|uniref:Uncharacterized protein n=1 Tax=Symbiochloris irregularis TaxID=706552 RepID=A0AAW1P276_9CHLO